MPKLGQKNIIPRRKFNRQYLKMDCAIWVRIKTELWWPSMVIQQDPLFQCRDPSLFVIKLLGVEDTNAYLPIKQSSVGIDWLSSSFQVDIHFKTQLISPQYQQQFQRALVEWDSNAVANVISLPNSGSVNHCMCSSCDECIQCGIKGNASSNEISKENACSNATHSPMDSSYAPSSSFIATPPRTATTTTASTSTSLLSNSISPLSEVTVTDSSQWTPMSAFTPTSAPLSAVTRKRSDALVWDDYFMSVAFLSAMRSKDPNTQVSLLTSHLLNAASNSAVNLDTQVGACIVNSDKRIVGEYQLQALTSLNYFFTYP